MTVGQKVTLTGYNDAYIEIEHLPAPNAVTGERLKLTISQPHGVIATIYLHPLNLVQLVGTNGLDLIDFPRFE